MKRTINISVENSSRVENVLIKNSKKLMQYFFRLHFVCERGVENSWKTTMEMA